MRCSRTSMVQGGMSEAINKILADALLRQGSLFGSMKKTSLDDMRDHRDCV